MEHPNEIAIEVIKPGFLDDISEQIGDMVWSKETSNGIEEGETGALYIADCQALDACNHIITGSFWLNETEYSFEVECGNWNGWVWRQLSDEAPIPDIEIHRTNWTLEPSSELVSKALLDGKGPFLVKKWDIIASREPCKSIPGKYSYDRHFAPGLKTETYWKNKAAEHHFVIVPEDQANETRKRLMEANHPAHSGARE